MFQFPSRSKDRGSLLPARPSTHTAFYMCEISGVGRNECVLCNLCEERRVRGETRMHGLTTHPITYTHYISRVRTLTFVILFSQLVLNLLLNQMNQGLRYVYVGRYSQICHLSMNLHVHNCFLYLIQDDIAVEQNFLIMKLDSLHSRLLAH